ncbi:hypothetical protein BCR44DRAFT_1173217 [Catenaria anguillulae PL171]|uniref:Uncharacterized protein n=1 Tax=Catenaria anguillulae PL171 TaxID=765915 RepID=A0A1Y2I339_9FUNG|nr:hypothetical protein BCR44DRAFT_1173217 [Catenaria anguillulae PL171]
MNPRIQSASRSRLRALLPPLCLHVQPLVPSCAPATLVHLPAGGHHQRRFSSTPHPCHLNSNRDIDIGKNEHQQDMPEGFSRFDLQHQQCTGCGASFQFDNPHIAGYLTPARLNDFKSRTQTQAHTGSPAPAPISDADLEARVASQIIDWKYISASQRKKHLRRARHQLQPTTVTQLVCQRCHDIHHTNHSAAKGPPVVAPSDLDLRKSNRSLFIHMVDMLDFPLSYFPTSRILPRNAPYLLVFNKSDLLPLSATSERLSQWATHFARRLKLRPAPAGVHVISSKSGAGIKDLMAHAEQLRNRYALRDVYLLGATNVGKSEFINCLHRMVRYPKTAGQVTASRVHGTTVANLPIPLSRFAGLLHAGAASSSVPSIPTESLAGVKGHLIDTPGVTLPARLTATLLADPKDHKLVHVAKRLVPVTYRVPAGKSIFFGGLARIDYVSGTAESRLGITVWSSNVLPVHVTSVGKADRYCGIEHGESQVQEEEDDDGALVLDPEALRAVDHDSTKAHDDMAEAQGGPEDLGEMELAPALQLDLLSPASASSSAADADVAPPSVAPEPSTDSAAIEPADQGPRMDPSLLPKILVPPSVDSRASLPQWKLAGSWTLRGDGIQRSWADIVVGSVGWISISGDFDRARFRVYTPGGKGAVVRDPLMPHDFGYPMKKIE